MSARPWQVQRTGPGICNNRAPGILKWRESKKKMMVIDTWASLEGAEKLMADLALPAEPGKFFARMPDVTDWSQTDSAGYNPE